MSKKAMNCRINKWESKGVSEKMKGTIMLDKAG